MISSIQEQIFTGLHISKEQLLNEMALLLARQKLSEYTMEVDYYEKKYGKDFQKFDQMFQSQKASYEMENDWMSWKFATDSQAYWKNILVQTEL